MSIDWENLFLNGLDFSFITEIALRTLIMFLFVLVLLRSSGKKGVRQLSIFEVAIIIALGSAAGDPMMNKDFAILPSLIVFAVILGFYRLLTYVASKSEKFEMVLEGEPMYIIEDGQFTLQEEGADTFAKDEFFAEMRVMSIEHVGQVKTAVLETNGQVSFFFYEDKDVRPGLPVLPKPYQKKSQEIHEAGDYACTHCGKVLHLSAAQYCPRCKKTEWVRAIDTPRIT
ncbi:YetF domain-containing protein [Pedobacter sp. SYP-B3415]|uniref:YetF domain-containing protein n=1 Tax=Pedobacter sp. SYP-B3415 TaxID=2496641 RepID=UPI00101D2C17|nr:YetF domain-containing protein [Pedobacter sp. SYP-B3415]